jgi:protoporphyrin/coproporphyrin ferrochelatase
MKYTNSTDFDHSRLPRIGVLVTNLGTPTAPDTPALRRYLRQFLADPRVVEVPRLLWWFVLRIILLIRPARSAAAYRKVWTQEGSPLLVHTRAQARALQGVFEQHPNGPVTVAWAMRYGEPSIATAAQNLLDQGVNRLLVLPLYPQYSGSTTGSTFDALAADFSARRWLPELRFVTHYHDHPAYIKALADRIRGHWEEHGRAQKMIFSYHGVPQRYLDNGDPYHCECHKTSRLLAEALGLEEAQFTTTFQSRFGREPWLQPYTDETLKALPVDGVKSVQITCPGFSSDCLETLEEIAMENRQYFMDAGGEDYQYIPCLNAEPGHIEALRVIIEEQLTGWSAATEAPDVYSQRLTRAQ